MILEINSVDRTSDIAQQSLRYTQTLSKKPAKLVFSMVAGTKVIPSLGQSVVFKLDGVNAYFKGTITARQESTTGNELKTYNFTALDGYYILDRRLVIKGYQNTTAGAVIEDIITNFVDGVTFTDPTGTPAVRTARFNYVEPSRAIRRICNDIGWDWYIDADNVLHILQAGDLTAPVTIEDNNDSHITNSLNFDANLLELKNVIFVRGGQYEQPIAAGDAIDKYEANGVDNTFPLVYQYAAVEITVDGVAQNVGIDFIDDPADHDCLYNFTEKLVRFPDGTLTTGQVVRVFGDAKIPLIVQLTDFASASEYGEREHVEISRAINSIEEAENVASALINQWREGSREGSFKTTNTGFKVGQSVTIDSTKYGVNGVYKVNAVKGSMNGHNTFEFEIDFIKSGQTTFDDILVGLIGQSRDNITISANEVLQRLFSISDTFSMSDEIVDVTTKTGPYYYATAGAGREEGVWGFSTWGT